MSFPALDTLAADTTIEHSTWKVYMHLQRSLLNHTQPMPVKVRALTQTLRLGPSAVIAGLNQLVGKGYLIEHAPGARGVRNLTLAWSVPLDRFPNGNSSAA